MGGVGQAAATRDAPVARASVRARDARIDLIRGLSLLTIFFDHIPYNCFSKITLQSFGFCDAAELFVFLAGYSATMAYARAFETGGLRAGLRKVLSRCLVLWGAHGLLLLFSVAVLLIRQALTGAHPTYLAPLIQDGLEGILRGLTLQALPAYFDILPLYIVLLLWFPVILLGLRRNVPLTLAVSVAIYQIANASHYNLPNIIDARAAQTWSFNPFAWQLIYVIGAVFAMAVNKDASWLKAPSRLLYGAIAAYLVFSFVACDGWHLWPWLHDLVAPSDFFGNEPKSFATPWRVIHAVALMVLALSSPRFARLARLPMFEPILACGRHSLTIFCATCVLSLFGRIAFHDIGTGSTMQVVVNVLGIMTLLGLASALDARKTTTATALALKPATQEA